MPGLGYPPVCGPDWGDLPGDRLTIQKTVESQHDLSSLRTFQALRATASQPGLFQETHTLLS